MSIKHLCIRAFRVLIMAGLLFIPAGTIHYWQAWVFLGVFVTASTFIAIYLAINNPQLLKQRVSAGPNAEKETSQKIIMTFMMIGFGALLILSSLDHRFVWSSVPFYISILGDVLIALGFILIFFVFRENSWAASTVQVAENQKVITTGPYALARHPMYTGVIVLLIGTPLALGSWWGLPCLFLITFTLVWRLLDEERFLHKHLEGYTKYTQIVKYRLIPGLW